jgi:tRNA A37 threonylcarbamoyladenosine modification protein TsaB
MKLYINSIKNNSSEIEVKLIEKGVVVNEKSRESRYRQSENLLPLIQEVLNERGVDSKDIKQIEVENNGGSFTSTRIGVTVANALGYAWGVPVKGSSSERIEKKLDGITIARPVYNKEPNITI